MRTGQHIFLSYRSLERALALKLAATLRNAGVKLWVDCLPEGIQPGDDWPQSLEEALNRCRALIAVVSPDYVASKVCRRELHRADQLGRIIFPVLLKPVEPEQWPLEIERLQYIDFTNWSNELAFSRALDSLLNRLQSESKEVIGQRPDVEQQYLITLIADLEARRGVMDYIGLAADLTPGKEEGNHRSNETLFTEKWGLDAEFTLLETRVQGKQTSSYPRAQGKRVENILEMIKEPCKFVLLGEPGAGKTTTLRRLALEAARARLDDSRTRPLPMLLLLPHWLDEPDPVSFVKTHWPFEGDPPSAIAVGDVILFFDGLNEMGGRGVSKVQQLKRWLKSGEGPQHLVVACRAQDYRDEICLKIDEVVIQPMDMNRISSFVTAYLQDDTPEFLDQIMPRSPERSRDPSNHPRSFFLLAQNPYLLTCLMILYQQSPSRRLPRNTGTLFRSLVEYLWSRELIRQTRGWISFEQAEPCFATLAFRMIEENQPTNVPRQYATDILGADNLHVGLSASILDCEGNSVRFYHQLMQEYFAAIELNHVGLGERVGQTDWNEVIVALCGIAETPDAIVRVVVEKDIYLAARCVASGATVKGETCRIIASRLLRSAKEYLDKAVRKKEERTSYLKSHPDLSWSSKMMMDDALDNYFGYPEGDFSKIMRHLKAIRLAGSSPLNKGIVQEISQMKHAARQAGI